MPNIGRPSQGCYECRQRRTKCDMGRPECQRCFMSGKRCPGYRDESDLIFKHESVTSLSGLAGARDRRRTKSEGGSVGDAPSDSTSSDILARQDTDKLSLNVRCLRKLDDFVLRGEYHDAFDPRNPDMWGEHAIILALSLFSHDAGDYRNWGYMEFLPSMLEEATNQSPFRLACTALGLAFLANRFESSEARRMRDQALGTALKAINSALGDPKLSLQDEAPVAIWLLGNYEVSETHKDLLTMILRHPIDCDRPPVAVESSIATSWSMHASALVELIKLRGSSQLQNQRARNIFWVLCTSVQIRSLLTGLEYPPFISTWLAVFSSKIPEADQHLVALNNFASQAAATSHRIRQVLLLSRNTLALAMISETRSDLECLHEAYCAGMHLHPMAEPVRPYTLYIRNTYRTLYLRSCHLSLDSLNGAERPVIPSDAQQQLDKLVNEITITVKTVCSEAVESVALLIDSPSAPSRITNDAQTYVFNRPVKWFDYLKTLWCLRIIGARKNVLAEEQVKEVERLLGILGSKYCIRQAWAPFIP